MRNYSTIDQLIGHLDQGLRTVFGRPESRRATPRASSPGLELSETERAAAGSLMRVNHTGEVCAQALYQGQALTAQSVKVRQALATAASEENDHLAWCEERIDELGSHKSFLNPFWYLGSMAIGAVAGLAGDRWSLGFVTETERQVVRHLESHLQRLPATDTQSRAIVEQMRDDEAKHANTALKSGAVELPDIVKRAMRAVAGLMTTSAAHL